MKDYIKLLIYRERLESQIYNLEYMLDRILDRPEIGGPLFELWDKYSNEIKKTIAIGSKFSNELNKFIEYKGEGK